MPNGRVNWRRGMSLGPAEIYVKVIAPAITPATVNRQANSVSAMKKVEGKRFVK
ncbi:hypothetical protein A2U01_0021969 [Trifolium medium]|uniref:Uncharacterized protein n=1 Tax=Trifolium medium TaxID=97028 RepID=A0A392NR25_9FABA|nr:hypothetical protein [Trifolium medium]